MARLFRLARWAFALACFTWSARQIVRSIATRRERYGVTPWGEPTGLRIAPLDPAETADAKAREWADFMAAWAAVPPDGLHPHQRTATVPHG